MAVAGNGRRPPPPATIAGRPGAALFLFRLGNTVVFFGIGGALLADAAPGGVVPRWLALGGGALSLLDALLFVGVLTGAVGMMAAGPGAMLATLAMGYLGYSIWKRG